MLFGQFYDSGPVLSYVFLMRVQVNTDQVCFSQLILCSDFFPPFCPQPDRFWRWSWFRKTGHWDSKSCIAICLFWQHLLYGQVPNYSHWTIMTTPFDKYLTLAKTLWDKYLCSGLIVYLEDWSRVPATLHLQSPEEMVER